jgi:hypothetical protein
VVSFTPLLIEGKVNVKANWGVEVYLRVLLASTSRDSSVGIALSCGLDDRGSMIRFLAMAGNFSLYYGIQNGSGAHPASYLMGTRGSFSGGKAAGA